MYTGTEEQRKPASLLAMMMMMMITPAAAVENITAAREYMVSKWWNPRYTKQPLDDDECY